MKFEDMMKNNNISTEAIDRIPTSIVNAEESQEKRVWGSIKLPTEHGFGNNIPETFEGYDAKGEDLIRIMEEKKKNGIITDSKIIENGITDAEGLNAINNFFMENIAEHEKALTAGTLKPEEIGIKMANDEGVIKSLQVKDGIEPTNNQEPIRNEIPNKSVHTEEKIEPVNAGSRTVETKTPNFNNEFIVRQEPIVPMNRTVITPTEESENNTVSVVTRVKKEITKIVDIAQGSTKNFEKFKERRLRSRINNAQIPLPLSNAFIVGLPISSNAILEGLQYDDNKSEYDNMLDTLSIVSEFIEIKGLGKVDHLTLAKVISYLEFELLYLAVFKASTDGRLRVDLPCQNPECPSFNSNEKIHIDIDIDDIAHPENQDEFVGHVRNMQVYEDSVQMIKHSPSNVEKEIVDKETGIKYVVGLPSILDFLTKSLNYQNENNRKFSSVLQLIPFVRKIEIPDYEEGISYTITTFDQIFEELLRNTPQEIFEAMSQEIEDLIKGKLVTFYIDKEQVICPICKKPYTEHLPLSPRDLLFQIPAVRKTGKLG